MIINHSARSGGKIGISFRFSLNESILCVYSLESPHRGDSHENTQYSIFNLTKKITLYHPKLHLWDLFQETQERARNSRGKRAISVRATESLLYSKLLWRNMGKKKETILSTVLSVSYCTVWQRSSVITFMRVCCSERRMRKRELL